MTTRFNQYDRSEFAGNIQFEILRTRGKQLLDKVNVHAQNLLESLDFPRQINASDLPEWYFYKGWALPFILQQHKKAPIRMTLPFGGHTIGGYDIMEKSAGEQQRVYRIRPTEAESYRPLPIAAKGILENHSWDAAERDFPDFVNAITIAKGDHEWFEATVDVLKEIENFTQFMKDTKEQMLALIQTANTPAKLEAALTENGCGQFISCIPNRQEPSKMLALRSDQLTAGLRGFAQQFAKAA